MGGHSIDPLISKVYFSGFWLVETRNAAEQSGFSAATRTEKGEELSRADL
jgi:hypothetical protein